jgi:hypothetical protein
MSAPGFKIAGMGQAQHGSGNSASVGAGKPYYPNASASRRRSDGNDGVVKMHGGDYSPQGHRGPGENHYAR